MPSFYSANVRTPFAVLGIRTADGMVTRIQYLPMWMAIRSQSSGGC
jgi:hypothetical protein